MLHRILMLTLLWFSTVCTHASMAFIEQEWGPFGPQPYDYKVPENAIFVAPDGVEGNLGGRLESPTTLHNALRIAETGATIVLRGGVYRVGDLRFSKALTLQAYRAEKPILKGSKVASEWTRSSGSWTITWPHLIEREIPHWRNEQRSGPASYWRGDIVFIDGEMLTPVDSLEELKTGHFFCDYENKRVYIADDPARRLVEIVAEREGLIREHSEGADTRGPSLKGLTFKHYGLAALKVAGKKPKSRIERGSISGVPVDSLIENCTFTQNGWRALDITSARSTIRFTEVSYNVFDGVAVHVGHESLIEHCEISHNNPWGIHSFTSGLKVFNQSADFVTRKNRFIHNDGVALWYDVGHFNGIIYNNYVEGSRSGICFEISERAWIFGNVIVDCHRGVWVNNAADVNIYNNALIRARIDIDRSNRGADNDRFGWHASTGPGPQRYHGHRIANNVFAGNPPGGKAFRFNDKSTLNSEFQTELMASQVFLEEADYRYEVTFAPEGLKGALYSSLNDFRNELGDFESGSIELSEMTDAFFRDAETADYRLAKTINLPPVSPLPQEIQEIMAWSRNEGIGAFPRHE